jgi:hypothetical protein
MNPTLSDKKLIHASQPVYVRSLARWHANEKHFGPILPVLGPYCRAPGYS